MEPGGPLRLVRPGLHVGNPSRPVIEAMQRSICAISMVRISSASSTSPALSRLERLVPRREDQQGASEHLGPGWQLSDSLGGFAAQHQLQPVEILGQVAPAGLGNAGPHRRTAILRRGSPQDGCRPRLAPASLERAGNGEGRHHVPIQHKHLPTLLGLTMVWGAMGCWRHGPWFGG